jgi:hypothetical protein
MFVAFMQPAFHVGEILGFVGNYFIEAYAYGNNIHQAVIPAWLSDERARAHSDLLHLRRNRAPQVFAWSPSRRPYGVTLPPAVMACSCGSDDPRRWKLSRSRNHPIDERAERVFTYTTKCCSKGFKLRIELESSWSVVEHSGTSCLIRGWDAAPKHHIDRSIAGTEPADAVGEVE